MSTSPSVNDSVTVVKQLETQTRFILLVVCQRGVALKRIGRLVEGEHTEAGVIFTQCMFYQNENKVENKLAARWQQSSTCQTPPPTSKNGASAPCF